MNLPNVGAVEDAADDNPLNNDLVVVAAAGAAAAVDAPPNNDVVPAVDAAVEAAAAVPKESPPVAGLEVAVVPNKDVVPVDVAEEAGAGFVAALPNREGVLEAAGAVDAAPPNKLGFVAAPPPES